MKKNIILFIASSVIISFLIMLILKTSEKREEERNQFIDVVVAQNNIPRFTLLTTNDVKVIKVPRRYRHVYAYKNIYSLFTNNQPKFYSRVKIYTDTQITKTIIDDIADAPFHVLIPEGMRAVEIPVLDQDFLDLLLPGSKIDFILRLYDTTLFLFQNIMILKKGNATVYQRDLLKKRKNIKSSHKSITVLLSPKDVLRYFYMINNLGLDIIARSKQDDKIIEGTIIKRNNFMTGNYAARKGVKELSDLTKAEQFDIMRDFIKSQKNAFLKENIGVLKNRASKSRNE